MRLGVILYGPPAAGKDTVTAALATLDAKYRPFPRLKLGGGRTFGYRIASDAQIAELRNRDQIIWENSRYDAAYFVDRAFLWSELNSGVPVLHLGQSAAIKAVRGAFNEVVWLCVYLWCPREVAASRIVARGTGDTEARLAAWDATEAIEADVTLNTAVTAPDEAARLIDGAACDLTTC
ncbi:hypothetical protein [Staphylococcus capitis]|uniref:hypothetical protein n=1 Tax=Staphylococcus capitis TaxID=29388 RepID=UPI003D045E43